MAGLISLSMQSQVLLAALYSEETKKLLAGSKACHVSDVQVLAPQTALQLVDRSRPQQDRQKGLNMLSALLWKDGQPAQGFPVLKTGRAQYLKTVRAHLTAKEQVLPAQKQYNLRKEELYQGHLLD